jgi:hypothetical protein
MTDAYVHAPCMIDIRISGVNPEAEPRLMVCGMWGLRDLSKLWELQGFK